MVRLDHEPYITHISHPHQLELCNTNQALNTPICSGCKIQTPSGLIYSCRPCSFSLHISCAQMPQLITHPSHPNHPLSLLPLSSYPQGLFNCDACDRRGSGFSYHCNLCDFDLHILCASKPLSISHQFHPNHPLQLTFVPPYGRSKGFSCDICRNIGVKQWLYRCNVCEFDVHLDCATATPRPAQPQTLLHQNHSFSGTSTYHHQQPSHIMHSASLGAQPNNQALLYPNNNLMGMSTNQQIHQPNHIQHSVSLGAQPSNQQVYGNNNLMGAMVNEFVEGAAQEVGQTFMQTLIGSGGGVGGAGTGDCGDVNGGDVGGGGGGDASSGSIFSVGSSILSSMMGGDSEA